MEKITKNEKMPTCPLSRIRKLNDKTQLMNDDTEISLELVLTACFPTVWTNIQRALNDQYTQGYLAGLKEANENQGNN